MCVCTVWPREIKSQPTAVDWRAVGILVWILLRWIGVKSSLEWIMIIA